MSEYINGWDMQDAISRCADLEAELARERRDHAKLVEAAKVLKDYVDLPPSDYCSREMNDAWEVFKALDRPTSVDTNFVSGLDRKESKMLKSAVKDGFESLYPQKHEEENDE
jgi:hypothetical protein